MESAHFNYALAIVEKDFHGYELDRKVENGQVSFVAFLRNDINPACRAPTLELLKNHVMTIVNYDRRIAEGKDGSTIGV